MNPLVFDFSKTIASQCGEMLPYLQDLSRLKMCGALLNNAKGDRIHDEVEGRASRHIATF